MIRSELRMKSPENVLSEERREVLSFVTVGISVYSFPFSTEKSPVKFYVKKDFSNFSPDPVESFTSDFES